jgi:ATP/maltotriose-dependent transcriptional regulator MalT
MAEGGELSAVAASIDGGAVSTNGDAVAALVPRQAGTVFGLLRAAVEEAAAAAESRNAALAAGLRELQMRALHSIEDSAYATIELLEALGAARTPGELTRRQIGLARRHGEAAGETLAEFLQAAYNIAAAVTFAPMAVSGAPKDGDMLRARLDKLTARQKCVLHLLAEGLPNKVIAHRLGISETTVKAHVGEILRKLKVYSRARAIVMLAQLDMTPVSGLSNCREGEV